MVRIGEGGRSVDDGRREKRTEGEKPEDEVLKSVGEKRIVVQGVIKRAKVEQNEEEQINKVKNVV